MVIDHYDTLLNFNKSSLNGAVALFSVGHSLFTHIAFSGRLPPDYQREAGLYGALVDNILSDCLILDVAELTIAEDTAHHTLAFLLGLVLHSRGEVAFVAGGRRVNRGFLGNHFGSVAPIHRSLDEALDLRCRDRRQPSPGWVSGESARPQKFS